MNPVHRLLLGRLESLNTHRVYPPEYIAEILADCGVEAVVGRAGNSVIVSGREIDKVEPEWGMPGISPQSVIRVLYEAIVGQPAKSDMVGRGFWYRDVLSQLRNAVEGTNPEKRRAVDDPVTDNKGDGETPETAIHFPHARSYLEEVWLVKRFVGDLTAPVHATVSQDPLVDFYETLERGRIFFRYQYSPLDVFSSGDKAEDLRGPTGLERSEADRGTSTSPLPCRTPTCTGTLLHSVAAAKAVLDAMLMEDPDAQLAFNCHQCNLKSTYSREAVVALFPPDLLDLKLAALEFWAFIMAPFAKLESGGTAFAGEAVLLRKTEDDGTLWTATLLSPSRLAPSLRVGDVLIGYGDNAFDYCSHVLEGKEHVELSLSATMPERHDFALFFETNREGSRFESATLFCENESCYYPFKLRYSEWVTEAARIKEGIAIPPGGRGFVTLECPRCGLERVMTERSWDGVAKT